MALEKLFEMHASNKFHDHEILSANLAQVVGLNDVGVDQIRDQSSLADEVLLELRDGRVFLTDQFDRDDLAEVSSTALHRFIDQSHAPFSDLSSQLIVQLIEDVLEGSHGAQERAGRRLWQERKCKLA